MAGTVARSAEDHDWHCPVAEPSRRDRVNAKPAPQSCVKRMAAMVTYYRIDFFASPRLVPRQYAIEVAKLYRLVVQILTSKCLFGLDL
jgi:hypothetical protein